MKYLLSLLFLSALTTFAAETTDEIFNKVAPSVVTVEAFDDENNPESDGSGVILSSTQIVTNCHVTEGAKTIQIKTFNKKEYKAKLSRIDVGRDICLLQVDGLQAKPASIRTGDINIGERVYAVGNPLGFGLAASAGLISNKLLDDKKNNNEARLITNAVISPGSSGGGLFDKDGKLVGITAAIFEAGQNVNIALGIASIEHVRQFGEVAKPLPPKIPRDRKWQQEANTLRSKGDWQGLQNLAKAWLDVFPTSSEATAFLGISYNGLGKFTEAIQLLNEAKRKNPHHYQIRIHLAHAYFLNGMKEKAIEEAISLTKSEPAVAFTWLSLTEFYLTSGDIVKARDAVSHASRLSPGNQRVWDMLSKINIKEGKIDDAIQNLQTSLRINPNDQNNTRALALLLASGGRATKAEEVLGKNIDKEKQEIDATIWIRIGQQHFIEKKFADAEKAYQKAIDLAPKSSEAWHFLGNVLYVMNRRTESEKALRKALELNPRHAASAGNLGFLLLERGDKTEGQQLLELATSVDPSNVQAWRKLAILYFEDKNWKNAESAFVKTTNLENNVTTDWAALGQVYAKTNRKAEAITAFQRAEQLDPNNVFLIQALVSFYGQYNDDNKALEYSERALKLDSGSPHNWSNKGYSLLKLKRFDESIEALQTAIRLEPNFVNAWINLGNAYLLTKNLGKAIATLQKAITLKPDAADAIIYLAQAYAGSGQFALANEQAEKLLARDPNLFPALYVSGISNIALGNRQAAFDIYAKLKSLNPEYARKLKAAALTLGSHAKVTLPD